MRKQDSINHVYDVAICITQRESACEFSIGASSTALSFFACTHIIFLDSFVCSCVFFPQDTNNEQQPVADGATATTLTVKQL